MSVRIILGVPYIWMFTLVPWSLIHQELRPFYDCLCSYQTRKVQKTPEQLDTLETSFCKISTMVCKAGPSIAWNRLTNSFQDKSVQDKGIVERSIRLRRCLRKSYQRSIQKGQKMLLRIIRG